MTIWGVVGVLLGMAAYPVAWFWGGRPERFAAAVMLLHFALGCMSFVYGWELNGNPVPRMMGDYVRFLIFCWFCFRSNRWWPFLMTVIAGLMITVEVVAMLDPGLSFRDGVSAKIGLAYLLDLTLMFSFTERILAGEPPAARQAWARAHAATAARRNRKKPPRLTSPPSRPTSDR